MLDYYKKLFFLLFSLITLSSLFIFLILYLTLKFLFVSEIKNEVSLKNNLISNYYNSSNIKNLINLEKLTYFSNENFLNQELRNEKLYFPNNDNIIIDFNKSFVYFIGNINNQLFFLAQYKIENKKQNFLKIYFFIIFTVFLFYLISIVVIFLKLNNEEINLKNFANKLNSVENSNIFFENIKLYKIFSKFLDKLLNERKEINFLMENLLIFNNILDKIQTSIIIIDKYENIIFSNENFKKIFYPNPENKKYWEVLTENLIINFIENNSENIKKISIKGKFFELIKLIFNDKKIIILNDQSKIESLEENKKEFISYLSHEVRTPLSVIKGYLELISSEKKIKKINEYVKFILINIERLIKQFDNILTIYRIENKSIELSKTNFNIKKLITEIKTLYSLRLKENKIKVKIEIIGNSNIYSDYEKFYQILTNLFDNSVKFTKNGKIVILVKNINNYIEIEFSDTGEGIEEKDLLYIFDKFYKINKNKSGFGLGLSIVKHLVNILNGSIDVESKKGVGTKFKITIPI